MRENGDHRVKAVVLDTKALLISDIIQKYDCHCEKMLNTEIPRFLYAVRTSETRNMNEYICPLVRENLGIIFCGQEQILSA